MGNEFRIAAWLIKPRLSTVSCNGEIIRLEPKVMDVLVCLAQHAGEPVSKEELLQTVWPDTFVTEDVLKRSISELRRVFGDDVRESRIIQTIPKRGYRLIEPVEPANSAPPASLGQATPEARRRDRNWWTVALFSSSLSALVLFLWWLLPTPVPVVQGVSQLTDDGEPKAGVGGLVTDGLRVYFNEGQERSPKLAQVSVTGGQTGSIATKLNDGVISDLAPDASALLIGVVDSPYNHFWLQPLPAGQARSLGIDSESASFSADGRILSTRSGDLFIAEKDGAHRRKLATAPGRIGNPSVSPDGSRIRFGLAEDDGHTSIWEVKSDGSGLHQVLKARPESMGNSSQGWTRDGKYFLFTSEHLGRWDVWALADSAGLFHRSPTPIQLTNGPLSYESLAPSPNGKQIFVFGSKQRGELVRYDAKLHQFVPYLSGISAIQSKVSPDGKWVVYVSYPEHTLWRTRADGSERSQLTFPPMMVFYPEISPDGTKVAFSGLTVSSGLGLFVLSMEGGQPERLLEFGHGPTWSPDGNSLAFTALVPGKHGFDEGHWCEIHTIDLRTKRVAIIPGQENRLAPWWPHPDALVAFGYEDHAQPHLFNFKTQKWSQLANGIGNINWTPSVDGKFLYFLGDDYSVMRISSFNYRVEKIVNVQRMRLIYDGALQGIPGGWIGIATDGSVTFTRDVGSEEVYALDVKWP